MIIRIKHNNVWASLEGPVSAEISKLLYEELKYRPDGVEHTYSFKSGRSDGFKHLYSLTTDTFRRGLLDRVVDILKRRGLKTRVRYNHDIDQCVIAHHFDKKAIRHLDFQDSAVKAGIENDLGIIVSPTGTGKGVIISKLIDALSLRTLIIVTDLVLLDQMSQVLQKYFDQPIGIIGDTEFDIQDITVSTVQSLVSLLKLPNNVKDGERKRKFLSFATAIGAVIVDEVHLADSDSFGKVMPLFVNANKVIGTSATPFGLNEKSEKKENLELEQHFGTTIFDARKLDFVKMGLKVPLEIQIIHRKPINVEYKMHTKKGRYGKIEYDWSKNYREALNVELLNNPDYWNDVSGLAWRLMSDGKSVFIYAPHSVNFGKNICNLIPGAALINGSTPRIERRRIYDAMRCKELLAIVSDIGGTGLDIPNLDAIILAGDSQDVRQLIGRVSRASPGKEKGVVIDFNIDTMFMKKHANIRRAQYKDSNATIIEKDNI